MSTLQYKKVQKGKYKYALTANYVHKLPFYVPRIKTKYFETRSNSDLSTKSLRHNCNILVIFVGYQWDGASGPTIDTKNTIKPSCVHDVFYQAIREKLIPMSFKVKADKELRRMMIEENLPMKQFLVRNH